MERLLFKQRKTASLQDTLTQELVRLSCSRKALVAISGLFLSSRYSRRKLEVTINFYGNTANPCKTTNHLFI